MAKWTVAECRLNGASAWFGVRSDGARIRPIETRRGHIRYRALNSEGRTVLRGADGEHLFGSVDAAQRALQ